MGPTEVRRRAVLKQYSLGHKCWDAVSGGSPGLGHVTWYFQAL